MLSLQLIFPLLLVYLYIMILRPIDADADENADTRRSQSATIFDTFRKEKGSTNHGSKPPSKRLIQEDENPAFLISEASTATLILENLKEDQNLLITSIFAERRKKQQAMKLSCLKDKNE